MSSLNLCFTLPLCLIFLFVDTSFYTNSRIMMSFLDNFAQRLVSINLIQRHKTSFQDYFEHWVVLLLTIFAHRDVFLLTIFEHRDVLLLTIFARWHGLLLTIFARRLVTLRLTQRHKMSFSWQICTMSRPLVDNFAVCRHLPPSLLWSDWDLARICYTCHCLWPPAS